MQCNHGIHGSCSSSISFITFEVYSINSDEWQSFPKIWTRATNMHLTYVPMFLSSWMLNRYISRAKLHLISLNAGVYISNWRGVGLFNVLDTHANGKLNAPKFWMIQGNRSRTVLAINLTEVSCVRLKREAANTTLTATLAWVPWYNSSA